MFAICIPIIPCVPIDSHLLVNIIFLKFFMFFIIKIFIFKLLMMQNEFLNLSFILVQILSFSSQPLGRLNFVQLFCNPDTLRFLSKSPTLIQVGAIKRVEARRFRGGSCSERGCSSSMSSTSSADSEQVKEGAIEGVFGSSGQHVECFLASAKSRSI